MLFADTHTHLFLQEFDHDRDKAVERALDAGVKYLFIPNVDMNSVEPLLQLCSKYPENCFPVMGFHPESVGSSFESELDSIEKLIEDGKFYGIGETGLDYYWDVTFKEQQKISFEKQLKLAIKHKLPLIVHVRNSSEDVLEIIRRNQHPDLTGIFHCFSGPPEYAQQVIDLGFYLGIGGVVTFKNGGLENVISSVSIEHIVLETDSPYLAPVPFRGKRNESAFIPLIAKKIAEIKQLSVEEVADITTSTALKIFRIKSI